jgi:hypothetical protein
MNAYYVPNADEKPDFTGFQKVSSLFFEIFDGSRLSDVEVSSIISGFRALVHGFSTIAGHKGFRHPSDAEESFNYCLALFLDGVRMKLGKKDA